MIETTVTMSLERFKELESAETALHMVNKGKYFVYKSYGTVWMVSDDNHAAIQLLKERNEAVEARDSVIQKVRDYEIKTGKKVF
jgi:chaperonin cofactor prefoldin